MSDAKPKTPPAKLPEQVAKKYRLIPGIGVGQCTFKARTVDLANITVDEADELVKNGFNVLVPLSPDAKS